MTDLTPRERADAILSGAKMRMLEEAGLTVMEVAQQRPGFTPVPTWIYRCDKCECEAVTCNDCEQTKCPICDDMGLEHDGTYYCKNDCTGK